MRNTIIAVAIATAILQAGSAQASYWDGCGKYVQQYSKEPWASKELACERIKSCQARNKCHEHLDRDASLHQAMAYCEREPDARESGADDEHLISIMECAKRILATKH